MPKESFPAGVLLPQHLHDADFSNGATVGPDFNANTLATIKGATGGLIVRQKGRVKRIWFDVGPEDFAGAGGTLTFELRKASATGTALASITIALGATSVRGARIESNALAAAAAASVLQDGDLLFLVRLATGTVFTTGRGKFGMDLWVKPQAFQ